MQSKPRHSAHRLALAFAVFLLGSTACKDEKPVGHDGAEGEHSREVVPRRAHAPLKRRQVPEKYLVGLRKNQDMSVLTALLPHLQTFDPRVLPGSPTVVVLTGVPDHDADKLRTASLSLTIGCFQPVFEVEIAPEEILASATPIEPEPPTVCDSPGPSQGDLGALVGVIDTGAHIGLPGINTIVWTNPGETPNDNQDNDQSGYYDDLRGVNVLAATQSSPPYDAGCVDEKDADHGSRVAAIASGACGASNQTGTPLQIIPCRGMTNTNYSSEYFLMCLKYFVTLAADLNQPIVAVNGSFGTTTTESNSCEIEALEDLRDEEVLFVVAAGQDPMDPPSSQGRLRVANVVTVASMEGSASNPNITSTSGKSVAFLAAAVGDQTGVSWPVLKSDLACEGSVPGTVSFAVPQVSNLAGQLAANTAPTSTASWFARRNLLLSGGVAVSALKDYVLSGRVVPPADAVVASPTGLSAYFNCTGTTAAGRSAPVGDEVELRTGQDLVVQAYNLSCKSGAGNVPVSMHAKNCTTTPCEATGILEDTGTDGDEVAGDGLYGKKWTIPVNGWDDFTVTLWSTSTPDTFDVKVDP